jgi:Mrp family chromosome partitioning ATPase
MATAAGPKAVDGKGEAYAVGSSSNIRWHEGAVSQAAREAALGQKGAVLWFTGLSGSGKSTVAYTLEHALHARGKHAFVLVRARRVLRVPAQLTPPGGPSRTVITSATGSTRTWASALLTARRTSAASGRCPSCLPSLARLRW